MARLRSKLASLLRPDAEELDPRACSQIQYHRLLSLLGAVLVPLFGLLYGAGHPTATDPMGARLAIAGLFLGLFGLSYRSDRVRKQYVPAMRGVLYVLLTWFAVIAAINEYRPDYAVGLLLTYAVLLSVMGLGARRVRTVTGFAGYGLLLTAGGFVLAPEIQTSPSVLGGAMGTVAVVGGVLIRAQLQMETQLRETQAALQSKDRFLAEIGHDLRTSLATLIGYADLLDSEADLSDQHREFLRRLIGGGHRLEETLNEILRFAQSELGEMELLPERVSVGEEVRSLANQFEEAAREKDLALEVHLPAEESLAARLDRGALRRIVINLISNAIRYTEEGCIEVEARARSGRLILEVRDTGAGMSEQQITRALRPFRQTGNQASGGAGLGLAIVGRLTEQMGGELDIESQPGDGTRVRVELDRWMDDKAGKSGSQQEPGRSEPNAASDVDGRGASTA